MTVIIIVSYVIMVIIIVNFCTVRAIMTKKYYAVTTTKLRSTDVLVYEMVKDRIK
jgi:hypothetical protein